MQKGGKSHRKLLCSTKGQFALRKPLLNTTFKLIRNKDSLAASDRAVHASRALIDQKEKEQRQTPHSLKSPWRGFREIDNFMGKLGLHYYHYCTILHGRILPHRTYYFGYFFFSQTNGCQQTFLVLLLGMLPMDSGRIQHSRDHLICSSQNTIDTQVWSCHSAWVTEWLK